MPCYSPLKGWRDEETGGLKFKGEADAEIMEVACGQCIGCRLDRSRMWAMRICHEASLHSDHNGSVFVTLTYRDAAAATPDQVRNGQHIPDSWSLQKRDFQLFMKRLRKARPGEKLRYYHCGEYGNRCRHGIDLERVGCPLCNVGRPHYHAIIFNCAFPDAEPYAVQRGVTRKTSSELESLWGNGFVDVGDVSMQSAAYVARYVMKKITGVQAEEHYSRTTEQGEIIRLEPEYSTMSNGIGADWYAKYKADVFPSDEVPVPGQGVYKKVPRYYDEMLRAEDEQEFEEIKLQRQQFRMENMHEYTPERLIQKYKVKKAQVGQLSRNQNE